jgi:osmotically-inducible protein OsmY
MVRLPLLVAVVAASAACGASTATQESQPQETAVIARPDVHDRTPAAVAVPENPTDRGIRRELNLAISHDEALRDRQISFIVTNGDVNVTGRVRTEAERKKINDLALNIGGVKSVANGVLIDE